MENYIALFAALGAAALTGLFTTLISLYGSRQSRILMEKSLEQNHRTTLESTRIQIVGPMKEAWKNNVREVMAKLLASLHTESNVSKADQNILLYQLELMLDDKRDALCSEIRLAIRLEKIENRDPETEQKLVESVNKCSRLCFDITDETWKDIQGK